MAEIPAGRIALSAASRFIRWPFPDKRPRPIIAALNALSGALTNAAASPDSIQADGTFKDVMSDMTFNSDATDNSQQEIVLDPASLAKGTTYDLRVYVCNAGREDRQVNLAFVGDGQAAVETGFF